METIDKIKFANLRNEEWFQFHTEFKNLLAGQPLEKMGIEDQYPKFLSLYNAADIVIEQILKSAFTVQITQADELRDTTFRGFRAVVKGMMNHFNPEKKQSAYNLMLVFNQYGNLPMMSYSEETGAIGNFLQEMNGKYIQDVKILGLEEWIAELQKNNNDFNTLIMGRNEEQSMKPAARAVNIRKELDNCYVDMVTRIQAVALLQKDHQLTPFINKLNANINRYKNMLAQRAGRTKTKNEK